MVAKAKALGARFRRSSNVVAIERDGTHWKVTTSRGEIRAKRIVDTTRPWATEVARLVGGDPPMHNDAADGRHRTRTTPTTHASSPIPIASVTLKQMSSEPS